jgi:CBS domain-containing protein
MTKLREIMTTDVLTVSPRASIRETAEALTMKRIGGAPVLEEGRVLGIITASDILDFASSLSGEPPEAGEVLTHNPLDDHTVSEAMTLAPLVTLGANATVRQAAQAMRDAGVHRIPVMEGENLLGIVTSLDLAVAIASRKVGDRTLVFPKKTRTD